MIAVFVPIVSPTPISNLSVSSSRPILKNFEFPLKTIIVSSLPASPIVNLGVVPIIFIPLPAVSNVIPPEVAENFNESAEVPSEEKFNFPSELEFMNVPESLNCNFLVVPIVNAPLVLSWVSNTGFVVPILKTEPLDGIFKLP